MAGKKSSEAGIGHLEKHGHEDDEFVSKGDLWSEWEYKDLMGQIMMEMQGQGYFYKFLHFKIKF